MGIPKFYRWTSERYPCLSEKIKEYQIPEFDNLYLDMNGIIHNCSHPNDEDVHLRIPEQQIFKDIFHYIDFLFKMIKPCKVFFMAVDGVAPRAKMNQQRGRRFRSAKLAEDQEAEAVRKGETLPSEERFDSNCITPGTEFMARLHEQLKYFVQVKVSTDPLWQRQGLVIYLSGHDVPGEGEHKIMDFIRHIRSKPDYEPVRHCLYGLDADLVMLGLSTHELQFSLLREEVKFGGMKRGPKKGSKRPNKTPFNAGTASYDLSNVSIFNNESNSRVTNLIVTGGSSTVPAPASKLREGQSFVNAVEKPVEEPIPPVVVEVAVRVNEGEVDTTPPPPPPDESKAKGDYRAALPEKTVFLLLHLSLMRDYIDFEFQDLKARLASHPTIKYDMERIIDDWILMNILVGNDFVPHLPHFHIVKGALPMLYKVYTEVIPMLDGYLNEHGILNLSRFEVFLKKLSQFDIQTFRDTYDDMKYMESKTGKNIVLGEKMFEGFDFAGNAFEEEPLEPMSSELQALAQRTEQEVFGANETGNGVLASELFAVDDDYFLEEDSPEMRLEFQQHKRNYYISKLGCGEITTEFLEHFCEEYIRALQWVLLYYYKGVSSWGWYYPYHYAPFCSDLKTFTHFDMKFDKGRPFRPFEQLLSVLPSQSKKLLPKCYQWLMTDDNSPILDYYPPKFEQDLNGKKQDWEAVVLIPFIDEMKLLSIMQNEEDNLNTEEVYRNSRGTLVCSTYCSEDTGPVKSINDLFPPLSTSHVKEETVSEVTYDPLTLPNGIHPKSRKDVIYQGFPTLKSKPIQATIEKAEIKVFDFVTREESMVLNLEAIKDQVPEPLALARKLIDRPVWVNWPHLSFANVTAIATRKQLFYKNESGNVVQDTQKFIGSRLEKEFDTVSNDLVQRHLKCKGMKLGDINIVIYAKLMVGRKVVCNPGGHVLFETLWSNLEQPFALKTCIYEEPVTEIFYLDKDLAATYVDLYKVGDQVFYLGDKSFGAMGTVTGHNTERRLVEVDLTVNSGSSTVQSDANLKDLVGHHNLKSHEYFSTHAAAGKCNISSYVLSRITGTVYVSVEREMNNQRRLAAAKKQQRFGNKRNKTSNGKGDADKNGGRSSTSEEEFPALEMKKINIGLDLKFNKRNLEVRGYTSKRDGVWHYSGKAVQLVNDYVMQFHDLISVLSKSERGKDVYEASEIFSDKPLEKINKIVEWLDERGVRDLPRIATNTNLLDDDDIAEVWKYVLVHKKSRQSKTVNWTSKPNLLFKPGLDRGCVAPVPNAVFNILDRVVCVDRAAPVPIGSQGTVVGMQAPQTSEPEQIEESFKSTGAVTLRTLIILCDPSPGVFDNPSDFGVDDHSKSKNSMTGKLASLLNIRGDDGAQSPERKVKDELNRKKEPHHAPVVKPRLIKLYPYQLLNLSEGQHILRKGDRDSRQLESLQGFARNENRRPPDMKQPLSQNCTVQVSNPLRILQRPAPNAPSVQPQPLVMKQERAGNASRQKQPLVVYNSKTGQHLQNKETNAASSALIRSLLLNKPEPDKSKAKSVQPNRPGVLPWPPRPLVDEDVQTDQPLSVAAFLQKKLNVGPIPKSENLQNQVQVLSHLSVQVDLPRHSSTNPPPLMQVPLPFPPFPTEPQSTSVQVVSSNGQHTSTSNSKFSTEANGKNDLLQMLTKGSNEHASRVQNNVSSPTPPAPPRTWINSSRKQGSANANIGSPNRKPDQPSGNYPSARGGPNYSTPRSENVQHHNHFVPTQVSRNLAPAPVTNKRLPNPRLSNSTGFSVPSCPQDEPSSSSAPLPQAMIHKPEARKSFGFDMHVAAVMAQAFVPAAMRLKDDFIRENDSSVSSPTKEPRPKMAANFGAA